MRKRIVIGTLLVAAMVAILWLDWRMEQAALNWLRPRDHADCGHPMLGLPLAVLVAALVLVGYAELRRLAAGKGMAISRIGGVIGAIVATLPFWRQAIPPGALADNIVPLVVSLSVMLLFLDQLWTYRTEEVIRRIGVSLLGVCYLGVCAAVVLTIRIDFGLKAFGLFILAVKATDIGAYFTGSAIGRHKLIPWLSPGKSWEGLFGGMLLAAAASVVFSMLADPVFAVLGHDSYSLSWTSAAIFGLVVGLLGQGADLCESALKRDAGLKDSGSSIPAFGGILDVVDSPLLAAPIAYILLTVMR